MQKPKTKGLDTRPIKLRSKSMNWKERIQGNKATFFFQGF